MDKRESKLTKPGEAEREARETYRRAELRCGHGSPPVSGQPWWPCRECVISEFAAALERHQPTKQRVVLASGTDKVCGVCWYSAWCPVPTEAECNLTHPHEGEHARCDFCWLAGERHQGASGGLLRACPHSPDTHIPGFGQCEQCASAPASGAIPDTDVIAETLRGVPPKRIKSCPLAECVHCWREEPDYARMAEEVRALIASRCSTPEAPNDGRETGGA